MHGRSGAVVADPLESFSSWRAEMAATHKEEALLKLALAHRARGGTAQEFMASAEAAVNRAYGKDN